MPAPLNWTDIGSPPVGHGFVYSLCDPDNPAVPRYVGQTIGKMARRLVGHKHAVKRWPEIPISKWLKELFEKGKHPITRVLEVVPIESLNEREEAWILFFKPLNVLSNRSNGQGMKGLKGFVSESNRRATAERNRRGWTPEMRLKIVAAKTGVKQSPEQIANWMPTPGFKVAKQKLAAANAARKKKVVCVETGEEFPSVSDAIRGLKCAHSGFREAIKMGWKIRGRHWKVISNERSESCHHQQQTAAALV